MRATQNARRRRWRRVAFVVGVNLVGIVLVLLMLEGGVRLFRPDIGPAATDAHLVRDSAVVDATGVSAGLRPGATGRSHGAPFTIDADGFIAYTGNAARSDTAAAWLFLGDSVTMGIGVPPDSSFAGRLALRVDSLRVLNPSLIGYAAADYARLLDHLLADSTQQIARVTVAWCLNDVYPDTPPREPGHDLRRRGGGLIATLNQHSRLYRFLKATTLDRPLTYYRYDRQFYPSEASAANTADPNNEPPLAAALDHLSRMQNRCAAQGIPFEVVLLPYEPQLRGEHPDTVEGERLPQQVLLEHLRARDIPVTDVAPALAASGDPARLYLWSDGIHFSARGHAVVADALATLTL